MVACLGGTISAQFQRNWLYRHYFLMLWRLLVLTAMPHLAHDPGWIVDEAEAFW
jgi:hypothetical protein